MTSIGDNRPGDLALKDSGKKDRALETKRQKYKELMLKNETFFELVNRQQDLSTLKEFQDNIYRRQKNGKLQTCFSFNKVIFAMQYKIHCHIKKIINNL